MNRSAVAIVYAVELAISGKAKCRGPESCGEIILLNALRLGKDEIDIHGSSRMAWRHWGCVTPAILRDIRARGGAESLRGFAKLHARDQSRVKNAIRDGRVGHTDLSYHLKKTEVEDIPALSQATQAIESRKRKSFGAEPGQAGPSGSQTVEEGVNPSQSQVPLTQVNEEGEDNEEQQDEIYAELPTNVVGVRHYTGLVGAGELVKIVREPTNRYDSNAIRVLNATSTQVGHIPRGVAARLAPLMDKGYITTEGIMTSGNLNGRMYYELGIKLIICGPTDPEARSKLEPLLIWATPGQRGFHTGASENKTGIQGTSLSPKKGQTPGSLASQSSQGQQSSEWKRRVEAIEKARELAGMMQGLTKVDDAGRRATMLDALCSSGNILDLPVHQDPPSKAKGNLKNDLLKHQSQALQWCIEREYPKLPTKESDPEVQFWKFVRQGDKTYYYNVATKTPQVAPPVLGRGAFMADSMGLGKTLTMLSLIMATMDDVPTNHSNATLIIVPLSVLSNWTTQIDEHIAPGKLKYCIYHGDAGKKFTAEELKKYDVVLSTLQMVAQEFTSGAQGAPAKKKVKKGGGLMDVAWKRVILDEGHNVRNIKAKMSQAVCALDAERRWIVSGTPIVNSPNDLGSLLKFLRVCTPLDQPDYFNRLLSRPLAKGEPEAVELLKSLMSSACLRRTKEMQDRDGNPLVPLPPVDVTVVRVTLSDKERELYDGVFTESQKRFADFVQSNAVPGGPARQVPMAANVLSMLTRLRQLALHPALVPENYLEDLKASANNAEAPGALKISPEEKAAIQQRLFKAIQDAEECSVCFDTLTNPRILPCQHYFCYECIVEVIKRQALCPMDRRTISMNELLEAAAPPEDDDSDSDFEEKDKVEVEKEKPSSSKIQHLISLLRLIPSTEKSLVFSQFTGYLNLIAEQLDIAGIAYVRFDGSMSAKKRAEVLAQFSKPITDSGMDTEDDDDDEVVTRSRKGKGKAVATTSTKRSSKNPPVMLISLKAGALGLNLTVASRVFLMDPWWQSAIELQAIDRVNRIGQTKNVHVYQMVADDTVEARVLAIQDRKKSLIEQAFSGTQRKETNQQKKEARLQDLVTLFGSTT